MKQKHAVETHRNVPAAEAGAWPRLYALVILALAADIAFLWWLTERYR